MEPTAKICIIRTVRCLYDALVRIDNRESEVEEFMRDLQAVSTYANDLEDEGVDSRRVVAYLNDKLRWAKQNVGDPLGALGLRDAKHLVEGMMIMSPPTPRVIPTGYMATFVENVNGELRSV